MDPNFPKYTRAGHINLERPCDEFVQVACSLLPGTGVLPNRWRWISRESFRTRFKHLGPVVWAKTASYHMLLINGIYVFRIWTDSTQTALCDVSDELAASLEKHFEVFDVPEKARTKTKPLTQRFRIKSKKDVKKLILQTILTYGLA